MTPAQTGESGATMGAGVAVNYGREAAVVWRLRAVPPSLVKASRVGLVGDRLALYDELLRRGAETNERLAQLLGWERGRLDAARAWLREGGWVKEDAIHD